MKLATLFLLIFCLPFLATADCTGCYDIVKVEIKLSSSETLNGYVYESVSDGPFNIASTYENYEFQFVDKYINIRKDLTAKHFSEFDYDILLDEDKVRFISQSEIDNIKEFSRATVRLRHLDSKYIDLLLSKKPVKYIKTYFNCDDEKRLIVSVLFDHLYDDLKLKEVFSVCKQNCNKISSCINEIRSNHNKAVFLVEEFAEY